MAQTDGGAAWRTRWVRGHDTPLRRFLRTESGGAAVLLGATVLALVWANAAPDGYASFWGTEVSVEVGGHGIAMSAREWVNSGLMTFFFFVVGLEARRELDVGELRERRRVLLPVAAGLGGMLAAVLVYLAVGAGSGVAHGWGVAMSTDTAFALGMLALVGPRFPEALRTFLLTVVVVDDVLSLVVIATVYTTDIEGLPLLVAALLFSLVIALLRLRVRSGLVYLVLGVATWVALHNSGVDPVVVGLAMGLLTYAGPAARTSLETATDLFRDFREQPTPELARTARAGMDAALSPNERLQVAFHPWTSYVVVPLFAVANTGIPVRPDFLAEAYRSPLTWAVVVAYVVGKPLGVFSVSWLVTRLSRGRVAPPVGWVAVLGGGAIAGIGFTVSLLIATLAFDGAALDEAKLGILTAATAAAAVTWLIFRVAAALPAARSARLLLGSADSIVDLLDPVDPQRDHVRGPEESPVTVVEYGDFECPYCGQAEPVVRELLAGHGDIRYVWRHLPLHDVHPHAQLAAEASEAAARQGAFWEMHDRLLAHQDRLRLDDLIEHARVLGLDTGRFAEDLLAHVDEARVAEDLDSADASGVAGTPTFFINGRRHHGAFDIETLSEAVRLAKARALAGAR
ncbi:MAG: Na+/H+ antiporter NhaA [Frankiales bacterium]|nr:Na+/H+ antiporter NhaA [Frankiales bacterium]